MKNSLRTLIAAVAGASVAMGCTALLGSFEVTGSGETGSPDAPSNPDAPGNVGPDGSTLDARIDNFVPVVCTGVEVACNNVCTRLDQSGDHCGKCGHSCGGGACDRGVCQAVKLFTSTTNAVGAIAVNDTDLFFATDDNKLSSCPKTGCKVAPKQLAVMGYPIVSLVAVQKSTIVFESAPTQSTQRPALYSCPPAGCASPPASFTADGLNGFDPFLSVFADHVAYGSGGFGLSSSTCAAGTCSPANRLGSSTKGTHAHATGAQRMYFVDSAIRGSTIASCDLADTACLPATLIAGDNADVQRTAIEGGKLYWLKPGRDGFVEGKLFSCDIPTCTASKVSANGLDSPLDLVVDASGAYWLSKTSKLQRCAPNGCVGGPLDFAGPLDSPHSVVTDDAFVYWAEKTAVWRLAK